MEQDQPAKKPTVNVSVACECAGYAITITFDATPAAIPAALARLAERGIAPAQDNAREWQWTPGDDDVPACPICPKHGAAMPKRGKQGDHWFAHKVIGADGVERWCRGYRNMSDQKDGFLVE